MSYNDQIENYSNKTNSYIVFYAMHKTDSLMLGEQGTDSTTASDSTTYINSTSNSVEFLGFVNEFTENFASSWDAQQYYGKTDPIVGFKSTKRTISLAWKIPTATLNLAKDAYKNLNTLASYLYPYYMLNPVEIAKPDAIKEMLGPGTNSKTYQRALKIQQIHNQPSSQPLGKPPLFGVSWGQLIRNRDPFLPKNHKFEYDVEDPAKERMRNQMLICHIENFTMSPQIDVGYYNEGGMLYPKVWNCSVALTVQHTHELGRQAAIW